MKTPRILLVLLILASCSPAPAAAPAGELPTAVPSETLVPPTPTITPTPTQTPTITPTPTPTYHPLSIEYLRQQAYPASEIVVHETLEPGDNYSRYYVSYESEGLTIYALLTVPYPDPPETGWPVVVFNHGYIPPDQYRTTERYVAYVDAFAKQGYIVLRPDYRGHDRSEGTPTGTYGHPGYVIDVLNAVAAVKEYPLADRNRIGLWGHSMGGYITLRAMVVDPDIKAGVIWAGVVAPYETLVSDWFRRRGGSFTDRYGSPEDNPEFWESISANYYLDDLSGPLQLHHGTDDTSVPYDFSVMLAEQARAAGQTAELFIYEDDNHNISDNFSAAMLRSIRFFHRYVRDLEETP